MQMSKKVVNPKTEKQIYELLYQVVADLKDTQEAQEFLSDILTEIESSTVAKRLTIAYYLTQGMSYEQIRDELKVSSATIAAMQPKIGKGKGVDLALKKIEADEWATKWTGRIMKLLGART